MRSSAAQRVRPLRLDKLSPNKPLALEMRISRDDRAQPLLRALVPAIRIGVVDLDELLVGHLDFFGLGVAAQAQRLEGAPVGLVQRAAPFLLRRFRLLPGIARKDVERVAAWKCLSSFRC